MSVGLGETIRIEARTRWDALDLARRLAMHHTYLVQLGDARWHVCVRTEAPDEVLGSVRAVAGSWAAERGIDSVLRVGEREIELTRSQRFLPTTLNFGRATLSFAGCDHDIGCAPVGTE